MHATVSLLLGSLLLIGAAPAEPPDQAALLNRDGTLLSQKGDYAGALAHYERAIKLEPTNDKYLSNAASASWWLGDRKRAGAFFKRAVVAALDAGGRDRAAQYNHHLFVMHYVLPQWATDKRNEANQFAPTPALQAAMARFGPLYQQATTALQQGNYWEGMGPARETVDLATLNFGAQHPTTFAAVNQLADLHRFAGLHDKARPLYEDILRRSREVLGATHPDTLVYLNNLASVQQALGRHDLARPVFEEVVAIAEKSLGKDHPGTLTYQGNLVLNATHLERYRAAVPMAKRLLGRIDKLLGETHPSTLTAMHNLAFLHHKRGSHRKARPIAERCTTLALRLLGWAHPVTQQSWSNLVNIEGALSGTGPADLPALSVKVAARFLDPSSPEFQAVTRDLGMVYKADGEYEKATPMLVQSLAQSREAHGDANLQTLVAMNNLADLYLRQSRYDEARSLFETALAQLRALEGDTSRNTIVTMSNLALLYEKMALYDLALPLATEAVTASIEVHGEEHPDTLAFLNNQALIYNSSGAAHLARPIYERVLATRQRILDEHHPETLRSMHNLALLYHSQGLYDRALTLLEQAWALRKRVMGPNHPDALLSMNGLALVHTSRGAFAKARPLYEGVLESRTAVLGLDNRDTLISMSALAQLLMRQNLHAKALPLLEEVQKRRTRVMGANHPDTLGSMTDLGTVYRETGKVREAIDIYREVIRRGEATYGEDFAGLTSPLNELALVYDGLGEDALALPVYERVLALSSKVAGELHPDTLVIMSNLATLYAEQGQTARAQELGEEALRRKLDVLGDIHPATLVSLSNLALHHQSLGQWAEAEGYWRRSLRQSQGFFDQVLWGADEETRQAYLDEQHYVASQLLSFYRHHEKTNSENAATEVLRYALNRKGLLLKIGSEVSALARASETPALREATTQLTEARAELARLSLRGRGHEPAEAFEARLKTLRATIGKQEAFVGQSVAQLQRARREVTPEHIVEGLSEGQVLLDFIVFDAHDLKTHERLGGQVMVLVVRPSGVVLLPLGPLAPLAEGITSLRELLRTPTRLTELREVSRALYDRLWQPLTEHLAGSDTLFLVPDGPLHLLPFTALLGPDDRYVVQSTRLNVLASARDLVVPPAKGEATVAAIFAAPNYDFPNPATAETEATTRGASLRDVHFSPLPGTAKEAATIAGLLKEASRPVKLARGDQATEASLKQLPRPRLLHLATHGFFLDQDDAPVVATGKRGLGLVTESAPTPPPPPEPTLIPNPLNRSGLALVGANPGRQGTRSAAGEDGILTAMEVLGLDLVGTELVVLSACQTGIGKVRQGEGVYGLQRSFLEAGARAVLSTLWSVDDDATQELMTRFYRRYLDTGTPQRALRDVQREMLSDARWQHPFYWAPFVMTATQ